MGTGVFGRLGVRQFNTPGWDFRLDRIGFRSYFCFPIVGNNLVISLIRLVVFRVSPKTSYTGTKRRAGQRGSIFRLAIINEIYD